MTPLKTSVFKLPVRLFSFSLIKSWFKSVPILLLVIGLADVQAQTLPDATQNFTGYEIMSDGSNRMASPDGFFILSSSDNGSLAADDFGAFLNAGGNGETGYLEVQVNPDSDLGSFELESLFVGEYDTGGNADFENNTVTAYNGEEIVAESTPYNSVGDGVVDNYPIDYSVFSGKRIDRLRITFTAVSGTNFPEYNLVSFTIKEADPEPPTNPPSVTTASESNITATSATLGGEVTADGGATVIERGVVYGTFSNPQLGDGRSTRVQIGSGTGTFSQLISGLSESTQYYVRAYAINSEGTSYGSEESFTTSAPPNNTPSDISLSSSSVNQSGGANATVGSLSTTDADGGDTHAYSLVAGTGDDDNASFNISGNDLRANDASTLAAGDYSVRIQTDDGIDSFQEAFMITVVDDINDPPVLTATVTDPTFTEGGTAVDLYSGVTVSTVEPGQAITGMTLTVTNLSDGASEILGIDGSDVALTNGNTVTTDSNGLTVNTSVTGSTATITFTGASLSSAEMQTLIDGLAYRNASDNPSTGSDRVLTITSITDDGGSDNGGDDTVTLSNASTVTITAVNDAPVASNVSFSGTLQAGNELTGSYDYSDVEGDSESGSSYHWYRSDDDQGTGKAVITDATSTTYTLTSSDAGKYISFEVTPNDGSEFGSSVESAFQGPVITVPVLTTATVTDIAGTSATLGGEVTDDGSDSVTERGIVYSTSSGPAKGDGRATEVSIGSGAGVFTQNVSGLTSGTTYYVRAYAVNSSGIGYGAEKSFTTPSVPAFTSTPITEVDYDRQYSYGVVATLEGDMETTISANTLPDWLTLSADGQSQATRIGNIPDGVRLIGVAGDDNGNIYTIRSDGTEIFKIASDGTTTSWKSGLISGSVYALHIADGYIYIPRYGNTSESITRIPLNNPSAPEEVFASFNGGTLSLTDHEGEIYAANYNSHEIVKINKATKAVETVLNSLPPYGPFGLTFDKDENLYIATWSNRSILKYDGSNLTTVLDGLSHYVSSIKIDKQNNFYLSMSGGGIRKYTPDFSSYTVVSPGPNDDIWSLSFTSSGALVYSINNSNQVYRLQTGAVLTGTPDKSQLGEHPVVLQAGNDAGTTQQSFTIEVQDNVGPVVQTYSPVHQSTDIDLQPTLTITFDEEIELGTEGTLSLYDGSTEIRSYDLSVPAERDRFSLSSDQKTLTLVTAEELPLNTLVSVEIQNGSGDNFAEDAHGNAFAGFTAASNIWTFTTVDNSQPIAADFSTADGPYQNLTYTFDTSDFGFSDEDSDPLDHLRVTAVTSNGTLYIDANDNDAFDSGEELAAGDEVGITDLDAGNLQYITSGSEADSFTFEVFDGMLYSASTYTASLNVIGEPVISFVAESSEGDESAATKELEVSLSNAFGADVTVDYVISGTAENGSDYTLADGTLTIPSGDTDGLITIADIADDAVLETDETVIVTLDNPAHATLGTNTGHTYTITDNDAAAVTLADAAGKEDDGPITITATLDNAVQGGFTVDVSTANGTADTGDNDYTPVTGLTLTFTGTAGETQTFEVEPTADAIQENDETLTVSLDNLDNTNLDVNISDGAEVTISNDDAVPVFTSSDNVTVAENELLAATITVTDPDEGTTLSYSITGGADASLLSVDGATGELNFKQAPDFEHPADADQDNDYELTVEVDDGTNTASQNLTITVTNINEAPVVDAGINDQTTQENDVYTFIISDDAFADVDLNDDLTLTISNLPDGLHFDPSTGTISGTATNVDLGQNTVTVTATDASGASVSTTFVLTVIPEVPAKIVLATPETGSIDIEVQPNLTWEAADGADSYELRVATDDNFTNPVVNVSGLTNTSYAITVSLDMTATYYWQVRGENAGGYGEWSSVFSFSTIPEVPEQVVLESPANHKSSVDRAVRLAWSPADRAASYKLQIAEDVTFQQITTETSLSNTELQLNNELQDNATYFWRVRAENSGGVGAWSSGWEFTTAATAPVLSFPGVSEQGISIAPRLSWVSGYQESAFRVRLATDENFQSIVADTLVTSEDFTLNDLETATTYYWTVRIETDLNTSTWAPTRNFTTRMQTDEDPVSVEIVFGNTNGGGNGGESKSFDSFDYRLVGLPGQTSTSVADLFPGENGKDWKVFEDNGAPEEYLEEHNQNNPLSFRAGTGYWVLSKNPVSIDKNIPAVEISKNDTYTIALRPGWNIISNPFARAADWNQIQTFNNLSTLLYGYDRSFFGSDKMEPFEAYYVYNDSGSEFMLEIPYTSLDKRGSLEENKSRKKEVDRKIHLAINHVGEDITANLSMVYLPDPKKKKEATHYMPPLNLSKFGAAIIEKENTHREKILRTMGDTYSGETNHYTVEVKSTDRSEIRWEPRFEGMDNTTGVLIVDPESGRTKILADGETYTFMSEAGHKQFDVYTGNMLELGNIKDQLIPQQFSLEQNYPNPFNPTTTIRFALDVQDHVQLEVFNILGRKVQTLVNDNRAAGWHQISFDASRLASGTYFYRLIIGQHVKTRKMTLIK